MLSQAIKNITAIAYRAHMKPVTVNTLLKSATI